MESVLACLPVDELRAAEVLSEAARLAAGLNASLKVVRLYPESWSGPHKPHPTAWHLRSDEPDEALRRFAARNRVIRIVRSRLRDD